MNIVVLAGGTSTERDVSLVSGAQIYKALRENGHKALLLDVFLGLEDDDTDTVFERGDSLLGNIESVKTENPDLEAVRAMRKDGGKTFFGPNVLDICRKADVVFMALHGENGENGKVQAAFDLFGITYTGTDYLSSAVCMDKALAKEILRINGIPVPDGYRIKKGVEDNNEIPYPAVVKVTTGGSSVGVYIVNNREERDKAKAEAFEFGDEVVVEKYIKGREFSVGVINGKALPIIEIAPVSGFYDYKNKYQAGAAIETCPAALSKEMTLKMQKAAEDSFTALRLSKYARIDILLDEEENMFVLEANTLPGMTPTSLMPQEAAADGISYNQLCEKLINMAMVK